MNLVSVTSAPINLRLIRTRLEKRIIDLSPNKYRLTYNSTRHMKLNESYTDSNEPMDKPLSLLNVVYASVVAGARENAKEMDAQSQAVMFGTVNKLVEKYNETLIMNMTAREALLGRFAPIIGRLKRIAETFGLDTAQVPNVDFAKGTFGYVSAINGTWHGPFEIYTGYQATASSLGDLISYQGKRRQTYFTGRCNRLQASVGELRPIPIGLEQVLELYSPSFCRTLHMKPIGVRKLREGLAIAYVVSPEDLLSAELNPDNRCFCVNGTTDNYCSLNGVIQLAPCSYFAPLILALNSIPLDRKMADTIQDFDEDLLRDDIENVPHAIRPAQFIVLRRLGITIEADLTVTLFAKVERDARYK